MSQDYHQRPSQIYAVTQLANGFIEPELLCYKFDNAVATFGRWFDNKMMERDARGKPLWTIESLLADKLYQESGAMALVEGSQRIGIRGAFSTTIRRGSTGAKE